MNILCSDGKGQIMTDACLTCSLSGNQTCGFDYALLRLLFAHDETEIRKGEIHVTDITGCLRKAWYAKTQPAAEYVHEMLTRNLGTMLHHAMEGSDEHVDSELAIAVDGIVGRSDLVYKDGRLLDLKSTRWIYPEKLPYGSHALQVNIYAYLLRKTGRDVNRLQIQYVDMSGPTKCRACKVPVRKVGDDFKCPSCGKLFARGHLGAMLVEIPMMADADVEQFISERKGTLSAALEMGMPPEPEPGFLCNYCSHINVCQPGVREEE